MSLGRVKEKIVAAARAGHLLYYEDLLSSDMGDDDDDRRRTLYAILDKLNDEEHAKSGVWLSSIVVGENIGMPGEGFFRKYHKRFPHDFVGRPPFVAFSLLARAVFRKYRPAGGHLNYGILIDADNRVGCNVVDSILQKHQNFIVRRAFGNNEKWCEKLRRNRSIGFSHTPPKEWKIEKIDNATDFRLYTDTLLSVIRKSHDKRLIDVLYIISSDKGFKCLVDNAKNDMLIVQWRDNKGDRHRLG